MKAFNRKKQLVLLVFCCLMVISPQRQSKVDVLIMVTEKSAPESDSLFILNDPKLDGKLEILKSIYINNIAYCFQVYKIEKDSLKKSNAYLYCKNQYTHAYYHWTSDEIIEVKLVNFESDEKGPVILLSHIGALSTMSIIEKGNLE